MNVKYITIFLIIIFLSSCAGPTRFKIEKIDSFTIEEKNEILNIVASEIKQIFVNKYMLIESQCVGKSLIDKKESTAMCVRLQDMKKPVFVLIDLQDNNGDYIVNYNPSGLITDEQNSIVKTRVLSILKKTYTNVTII